MNQPLVPDELYDEIKNDNCVIFAGAGISTEGGLYASPTLYSSIKTECKIDDDVDISFPDLMQKYCETFDGGSKNKLIRKIIDRFEIFTKNTEIYNSTTMFHNYLASIPNFNIIVTTNWDTFFEREMNIMVPMVENNNLPFWDDKKRQLLKIHGCITRPHTMIITKNDYDNIINESENEIVINKLKDLMATKTFIFVGYSMRDKNIQMIIDSISKVLGEFSRTSYAIDPHPSDEIIKNWHDRKVIIIKVNGIAFIREILERMSSENILFDPELISFYEEQRNRIVKIHVSNKQETEEDFLSTIFQNGLIHQLNEIILSYYYGITVKQINDKLDEFNKKFKKIENDNKIEIAYWTGRIQILTRIINGIKEDIPTEFSN